MERRGTVLPFRRPDGRPVDEAPPRDPPEYTAAVRLVNDLGAFVALLVVRIVLQIVLPAVAVRFADPNDRRRVETRLRVAERSITTAVRMLVRGSRR